MSKDRGSFSSFLKAERARTKLCQEEVAKKAGVGLRFIRDIEQGKQSLRLDKLNQVLALFGAEAGPVTMKPQEKEDA